MLCSARIVGKRANSRLPAVELGVIGLSDKARPAASKTRRRASIERCALDSSFALVPGRGSRSGAEPNTNLGAGRPLAVAATSYAEHGVSVVG